MNYNDRLTSIHDFYLQETIKISATASLELLQKTNFRSPIWNIYISGLAYGIWISLCDMEFVSLNEIDNAINEQVEIQLN